MISRYPLSFEQIPAWAAEEQLSVAEARTRFAQYAILCAVAGSRMLAAMLVFKGGNALDFVWQPNRSTRDLDFSVDMATVTARLDAEHWRGLFTPSLAVSSRDLGLVLQVQSVRQQPPGLEKTFATYEIRVGYALPDEASLLARLRQGQPSTRVIPVEISINEAIGDDEVVDLDTTHRLRVSTLEDIVAEKLRALLQQRIRGRTRRQDLLDVAVIVRATPSLNRDHVGRFLLAKAKTRAVQVSRTAFHEPELAIRALQDYDALRQTTRTTFIPAEEALAILHAFVDGLPIPETEGL